MPNSDAAGFAGFFNSGAVVFNRVPARLDILGGIADYSGSNVCEGVLGSGIAVALQRRTVRIRTVQVGQRSLPVETRLPLDYLENGDVLGSYAQVRDLGRVNPLGSWTAYVGGSIFTLPPSIACGGRRRIRSTRTRAYSGSWTLCAPPTTATRRPS